MKNTFRRSRVNSRSVITWFIRLFSGLRLTMLEVSIYGRRTPNLTVSTGCLSTERRRTPVTVPAFCIGGLTVFGPSAEPTDRMVLRLDMGPQLLCTVTYSTEHLAWL